MEHPQSDTRNIHSSVFLKKGYSIHHCRNRNRVEIVAIFRFPFCVFIQNFSINIFLEIDTTRLHARN